MEILSVVVVFYNIGYLEYKVFWVKFFFVYEIEEKV